MNDLIEKFYNAFKNLDAETMAECYHENIIFKDPAFGVLEGSHAGNMWRMLCHTQKDKDFKITYSNIISDDNSGHAAWEAFYVFSKTGRHVHNVVSASFEFKDGKIITHTDDFNLRRWAIQAMGFKGYVVGGTSYFRNKLNYQTNSLLTKFESTL